MDGQRPAFRRARCSRASDAAGFFEIGFAFGGLGFLFEAALPFCLSLTAATMRRRS
jgi:hypothetical protein